MKTERDKYAEVFADYLIDAMQRAGLKQTQIARLAHVSRQTINQIVGKKPHSLTGKLLLPERETVDRIAKALGDPPAKARRAAGYSENEVYIDTVEEALGAAGFFDQKGLGEPEKQTLRPYLEMLDREVDRLIPAVPKDTDTHMTSEEFFHKHGTAVKRISGRLDDGPVEKPRRLKRGKKS